MMDTAAVASYGTQTLQLALLGSLPPVIAAALVGVLISLLQALTQIQEQTLGFAFKLIAVCITLYITLAGLSADFLTFSIHIFDSFPLLLP